MSKKNKKPAIIKRDTVNNWAKSTYIPEENVIIIMDRDDGSVGIMIGDGVNNVNDLPDILMSKKPPLAREVDENGVLIL